MSTPKYSLETEHEVLETLMHFSAHTEVRVQKAMIKLTGDCFYNPDNRQIFNLIRECFTKQEAFHFVDLLTLTRGNEELNASMAWLMDKYMKCHAGEASFEGYVNRLVTLSKLRKQLYLAEQMIREVQECASPEKSQELLATGLTEISGLSYLESKHGIYNTEIAEAFCNGEIVEVQPIPTTCNQLNDALRGGIMPKCLIFAAAAPSTGKTGFAIFLLDTIARAQPGTESLFFSLEMESNMIWMRHVGICAGKPFDKLNDAERMAAMTQSMMVPIKIYDTSMCQNGADLDFITTTCRLHAMEKKVSVIVVDYLGLVKVKGKFERNDLKLDEITRQLGQLAIELDCTVILLSQINRGAANRSEEDRCPWPHDAANGSGGHNSASLWFGLDRPELYRDDPSYRNQFVIKCRKNRFGDIFELLYAFNGGTFGKYIHARNFSSYAPKVSPEEKLFS